MRIQSGLMLCLLTIAMPVWGKDGAVTLPLDRYDAMKTTLGRLDAEQPPVSVCRIHRSIKGKFQKGLFRATYVETFEVHKGRGHVRVPILDSRVSLEDVRIDGKTTSLLKGGGMYTVGIDEPGIHEVRLNFFWGRAQDRFQRRLQFLLPEGGGTHITVELPEQDIDVRFLDGVITEKQQQGKSTVVSGQLGTNGRVDITWSRRLRHADQAAVKLEASSDTLFTMREAVYKAVSAFHFTVLKGETDTIELSLPDNIEIIKVTGDAVLQWATEAAEENRLKILLRYLVEDETHIKVYYQAPVNTEAPVQLKMPYPMPNTPYTGAAGIQGPAGLNVAVDKLQDAEEVSARDLPETFASLTNSPIIRGFTFQKTPSISLVLTRNAKVELTSTIVEEIQATTVVVEDGSLITKMKLRIRNNTREYLTAVLPEGAILTHSLVEGRAVRPAALMEDGVEKLLFPLRRSERIPEGGSRTHVVRPGETLSDIANFYYSDPTEWSKLISANAQSMAGGHSLFVGQRLRIPAPQGARKCKRAVLSSSSHTSSSGNASEYSGI